MRNMRKWIGLIAVLGALLAIGAAPAASQAASCTAVNGNTIWSAPYLAFGAQLVNCTSDVDTVEFEMQVGIVHTGWYDYTEGAWHQVVGPPNPVTAQYQVSTSTHSAGHTWYISNWCGGAVHNVVTQFNYRIHQRFGAWGPYHSKVSGNAPGYAIQC